MAISGKPVKQKQGFRVSRIRHGWERTAPAGFIETLKL
jgi:hypothetical protein